MKRSMLAAVAKLMGVGAAVKAQTGETPTRVVDAAARVMTGKKRLLAVRTGKVVGDGQIEQQNGGGNIGASPAAPLTIPGCPVTNVGF